MTNLKFCDFNLKNLNFPPKKLRYLSLEFIQSIMVITLPYKFQIDRNRNEQARASVLKILKIRDFNLKKSISFFQKLIEIES